MQAIQKCEVCGRDLIGTQHPDIVEDLARTIERAEEMRGYIGALALGNSIAGLATAVWAHGWQPELGRRISASIGEAGG